MVSSTLINRIVKDILFPEIKHLFQEFPDAKLPEDLGKPRRPVVKSVKQSIRDNKYGLLDLFKGWARASGGKGQLIKVTPAVVDTVAETYKTNKAWSQALRDILKKAMEIVGGVKKMDVDKPNARSDSQSATSKKPGEAASGKKGEKTWLDTTVGLAPYVKYAVPAAGVGYGAARTAYGYGKKGYEAWKPDRYTELANKGAARRTVDEQEEFERWDEDDTQEQMMQIHEGTHPYVGDYLRGRMPQTITEAASREGIKLIGRIIAKEALSLVSPQYLGSLLDGIADPRSLGGAIQAIYQLVSGRAFEAMLVTNGIPAEAAYGMKAIVLSGLTAVGGYLYTQAQEPQKQIAPPTMKQIENGANQIKNLVEEQKAIAGYQEQPTKEKTQEANSKVWSDTVKKLRYYKDTAVWGLTSGQQGAFGGDDWPIYDKPKWDGEEVNDEEIGTTPRERKEVAKQSLQPAPPSASPTVAPTPSPSQAPKAVEPPVTKKKGKGKGKAKTRPKEGQVPHSEFSKPHGELRRRRAQGITDWVSDAASSVVNMMSSDIPMGEVANDMWSGKTDTEEGKLDKEAQELLQSYYNFKKKIPEIRVISGMLKETYPDASQAVRDRAQEVHAQDFDIHKRGATAPPPKRRKTEPLPPPPSSSDSSSDSSPPPDQSATQPPPGINERTLYERGADYVDETQAKRNRQQSKIDMVVPDKQRPTKRQNVITPSVKILESTITGDEQFDMDVGFNFRLPPSVRAEVEKNPLLAAQLLTQALRFHNAGYEEYEGQNDSVTQGKAQIPAPQGTLPEMRWDVASKEMTPYHPMMTTEIDMAYLFNTPVIPNWPQMSDIADSILYGRMP